jgi:hypothetical protein
MNLLYKQYKDVLRAADVVFHLGSTCGGLELGLYATRN